MKKCILFAAVALAALSAFSETVTEVNKKISALSREASKLKKNPIFVWGTKQEGLSDKQKCGTSQFNIVAVSKSKEFKKYRSSKIIALNPVYICPLHKCIVENGVCNGPAEESGKNGRGYGQSGRVFGGGRGFGGGYGGGDEGGCKAMDRLGTSNFCNLGKEYDLSYRSWKLMKDKMPESEAQETRLKEIEEEIATLKARAKEILREQGRSRRGKKAEPHE
ncbi:MAG: hypothetical protein K6F50_00235 [Kiritimatiellae bacterium]|nr:hypothetical protein [Kiritimatiellia bacterium]